MSLADQTVDASWITEGKPSFRVLSYLDSPTMGSSSGIWDCQGPAKFRWDYTVDETIYVLEGSAELEYQGAVYPLHPGSVVFVPAGASVNWSVTDRVRKAFSLEEPGRARRLFRRIFPPVPVAG